MKKISYLSSLLLLFASCQKEELIVPTSKTNNVIPTLYITNEKDTSIWVDSFEIHTWDETYYDGVKYHENLINVDKKGIDTLYVIKTKAYLNTPNNRQDIIDIKSTKGLDLGNIKEGVGNTFMFDTTNHTLILRYELVSTSSYKKVDYHIYKK